MAIDSTERGARAPREREVREGPGQVNERDSGNLQSRKRGSRRVAEPTPDANSGQSALFAPDGLPTPAALGQSRDNFEALYRQAETANTPISVNRFNTNENAALVLSAMSWYDHQIGQLKATGGPNRIGARDRTTDRRAITEHQADKVVRRLIVGPDLDDTNLHLEAVSGASEFPHEVSD